MIPGDCGEALANVRWEKNAPSHTRKYVDVKDKTVKIPAVL